MIQEIRERLGEMPKGVLPFDLLAFATTIGKRYSMTQNEIIRLVMNEAEAASITSSGRARAEGEEMSAPGPAWSAEEEDLLRSLAAAGESAAAIATLLKRSHHAVRKRAHLLEIKLARSPPGPKTKGKY